MSKSKGDETMDTGTLVVVVVAIFALVIVGAFLVFRSRAKVKIDSPIGGMSLDASDERKPAIKMEDVTAKKGSVTATDKTGSGVEMKTVQAGKDVTATSGDESKKAGPRI